MNQRRLISSRDEIMAGALNERNQNRAHIYIEARLKSRAALPIYLFHRESDMFNFETKFRSSNMVESN